MAKRACIPFAAFLNGNFYMIFMDLSRWQNNEKSLRLRARRAIEAIRDRLMATTTSVVEADEDVGGDHLSNAADALMAYAVYSCNLQHCLDSERFRACLALVYLLFENISQNLDKKMYQRHWYYFQKEFSAASFLCSFDPII